MANFNALITPIGENLSSQEILLQQLSSKIRITPTFIDAGGLAVASKLDASVNRSAIVANNLATTNSFLQTQDGVMQTATKILDRIGQLKAMSEGIWGDNTGAFQTEFEELKTQLTNLSNQQFNGVDLFSNSGGTLTAIGDESGFSTFTIDQADLENAVSEITSEANLADVTMTEIDDSIQNVANLRAANGAQQSRVLASFDLMQTNNSNLNSALSTIIDVDLARTLTDFSLASLQTEVGFKVLSEALTSSITVDNLLLS